MGTAGRFRDQHTTSTPGPANYSSQQETAAKKGVRWGFTPRFESSGSRPSTESSYLKPITSLKQSGGVRWGGGERFSTPKGVHAGKNAPSRPHRHSAPSGLQHTGNSNPRVNFTGRFGTQKRFGGDSGTHTPGPAAPSLHQGNEGRKSYARFPTATRFSGRSEASTPGPAAYVAPSPHAKHVRTPTIPRAKRFTQASESTPGPGGYMPQEERGKGVKWSAPRVSHGSEGKGPPLIASPVPAKKSYAAPFGKSKRFPTVA